MIQYGEVFRSVRQRCAAFRYYQIFSSSTEVYGINEMDYLDAAYRFLYSTATKDFIEFCAKQEDMDFDKYCDMLELDKTQLI